MTSPYEVVRNVLTALETAGIPYMVVGSFAASIYGVSRVTHDLDVVVALAAEAVPRLAQALGEGFYFDQEAGSKAVQQTDMFNALHMDTGFKVDFWILRADYFARQQFERRKPMDAWGVHGFVASPEDTVLSKLLWYRMTPSERQLADVRDVLTVQGETLCREYLKTWARQLGVDDLLNQLSEEK